MERRTEMQNKRIGQRTEKRNACGQHLPHSLQRLTATALALGMAFAQPLCAVAAAPGVTVDEAVYINADYYGGLQDTTVVKGCNTNGLTEFVDYGNYVSVNNMSDRTSPVINGDAIKWTVGEDTKRFYFSAEPKEPIQLPWLFDVSYRRNGEPANPAQLAGADGLIEIEIRTQLNERASEYYKKNMLLQVVVMADMEKVNSIKAPGAQLQSVGKNTIALFMGLPGEENTYTVQIGTDSFESAGVIMTMVPATASQLSEIKGIKETMDKAEEAGDALYSGINAMLSAVADMKPGLSQVKEGVADLNEARKLTEPRIDSVLDSVDGVIASVAEASESLRATGENLEDAEDDLNQLGARLRSARRQISSVTDEMDDVEDDLDDLLTEYMENFVEEQVKNNATLMGEITSQVKDQVSGELTAMAQKMAVEQAGGPEAFAQLSEEEQAALVMGCLASIDKDTKDELTEKAEASAKKSILTEERLRKEIPYYANVKKLQSSLKNLSSELKDAGDDIEGLMSATAAVTGSASASIKDVRDTLHKTSALLDSAGGLLTQTQEMVRESWPYVSSGSEKGMEGMISTLDLTMNALDSTGAVKNANHTLKRIIDDEMDALREDNQLLEIDPEAAIVSCTSQRNGSPNTLQIIVRTHEISEEDQAAVIEDLETEDKEATPFQRMIAIFKKIAQAVRSVFDVEA